MKKISCWQRFLFLRIVCLTDKSFTIHLQYGWTPRCQQLSHPFLQLHQVCRDSADGGPEAGVARGQQSHQDHSETYFVPSVYSGLYDCQIAKKLLLNTRLLQTAPQGNHLMLCDRNTISTYMGNVEHSISFDANSFLECLLAEYLSRYG